MHPLLVVLFAVMLAVLHLTSTSTCLLPGLVAAGFVVAVLLLLLLTVFRRYIKNQRLTAWHRL